MDVVATILITIGAAIGATMAVKALRGHHVPKGLAILHGTAVGLGLILLIVYALTTESHHKHWDSIIIFTVAALGGAYVVHKDVTHQHFPIWVMVIHGLIGLGGLIWLIIHVAG